MANTLTAFAARRTEYFFGNVIGEPRITRHADISSANAQRHDWVIDELLAGGTVTYSNIHDEFRIETVRGTTVYLSVFR